MDKSIMIFLHGGGVSSWMWQEQVEILKNTYECFAPDLIGHGTRAKEQIFSMNESTREVISWIKENANGRQVILIGFSLGAQIAVDVLSREPDIVDIAVINSALVMPLPWLHFMVRPLLPLTYPLLKKDWFIQLQAERWGSRNMYCIIMRRNRNICKRKPFLRCFKKTSITSSQTRFSKRRHAFLSQWEKKKKAS